MHIIVDILLIFPLFVSIFRLNLDLSQPAPLSLHLSLISRNGIEVYGRYLRSVNQSSYEIWEKTGMPFLTQLSDPIKFFLLRYGILMKFRILYFFCFLPIQMFFSPIKIIVSILHFLSFKKLLLRFFVPCLRWEYSQEQKFTISFWNIMQELMTSVRQRMFFA